MRFPILIALALCAPCVAAPDREALSLLLRDLPKYDPTELPDDPAVADKEGAIRRQHGQNAEKELLGLKQELLEARFREFTQALADVAQEDGERAAKTLCEVFDTADERIDEADRKRDEAVAAWRAAVVDWRPGLTNHRIKDKQAPVYHRNRTDELVWRAFAYELLGLRMGAGATLAGLDSDDARGYLLGTALASARSDALRARLAQLLSADREAPGKPFLDALKKERADGVKAALLASLGRLSLDDAQVGDVVKYVEDRSERVRLAAVHALASLHRVEGIAAIVKRMPQEEGRTLAEMARSLESLTGETFGAHADVWQRWYESRGATFSPADLPPRDEDGHIRRERADSEDSGGFFYGIPQVSRKIIYVIDVSGSMKNEVGGRTRLEGCKEELSRAISQLDRRAVFNVILFNHDVTVWKPAMQEAGLLGKEGSAREEARAFYGPVGPESSTNIYDALRSAFDLTGVDDRKRNAELKADTIYLLTDGSPTTPDGQMDDTNKILEAARKWNDLGRVTIHCIAIGKDLNATFLRALAAEHNGEFIQLD